MQRTSRTLCLTTLFFAAGAALFFTKAAVIPYKVAYPVLLLSLSLFYLRLKPLIPVGAALLLSAVGDAAGAGGMFIPQMLFFALAHGAYMCYFLPQAQLAPRPFVWPVLTALLLYNKPLEYAQMVLSGEMERYLSLGCEHGRLED